MTKRQWPTFLILITFSLVLLMGCKTVPEAQSNGNGDYLNSAEKNYLQGEKAKKAKNYEEAANYFEYVKNQYPYSKFAALADLAIAETYMDSEQWLQAAESFKFFVQFHPKHPKVAWATFQIAKAYTKAIPKNYPIMPKSYEKDQGATLSAIVAWDRFLRRFPKDKNMNEAKALRRTARGLLTEQEWSIASFYEHKKRFQGALWRYETIFNNYPETPKAPEAMAKAIAIYQNELKSPEKAKALRERLLQKHPKSPQALQLGGVIQELKAPAAPSQEAD